MKTIILFIILILINTNVYAMVCSRSSSVCTDNSTKIISGSPVTRCWHYHDTYSCSSENFTDYCTTIAATPGCTQTNSVCKTTNSSGACDTYENTYTCGAKLGTTPANVTYLSSSYTISSDTLDTSACSAPQNDPSCSITSQVCTQGPATRNINGLDVAKDCWQYQYTYACKGDIQYDNCTDLNKNCTYQSKACISSDSKGNCLSFERSYLCTKDTGATPVTMQCQGQIYCINGDCSQATTTPDTGLVKGLTYMNVIKQAGDQFNSNDLTIFAGGSNSCSKAIGGFNNCCSDDGWGQDIGLASCSADETLLATKANAGQCHYVGTYCSSKAFFGICLTKKKTYCCFPSKLGRIIQEQGRGQVGLGWGGPESPSCNGLTIDQLQHLDFSKIDLSEMFSDIAGTVSVPDEQQVIDTMSTRVRAHYAQ